MTTEEDTNGDGRMDNLQLTLEMPLFDTEQVVGIEMLLFFYYQIHMYSSLYMDCMAYIQHSSAVPGAKVQVFGNLQTNQREPLLHKGIDQRYNESIIDSNSIYTDSYELSNILQQYHERNVTTELAATYYSWTIGRGAKNPFVVSATIKYQEQEFVYKPGLLYQLKWGWVQYVSLLFLFVLLAHHVKVFIFSNQLVNTIIKKPSGATGLKLS